MTNEEMLAKMEEIVSLTLPPAFTKSQVRDLLQTAYDYNMTFYCPGVPAKDVQDSYYYTYIDKNGKRYYELYTSSEQFQKTNRKVYPDGIELTETYFQIFYDDIKTREGFAGFSINPFIDRKGNIDSGYEVKLRGPGCIRILQNGRKPTASDTPPLAKGSKERPYMSQYDLWDKLDAACRIPDARRVKMAVASLLKKAYTENIPLLCAAIPTPEVKRGSCKLLFQPLGNKHYVVLLTRVTNFAEFKKITRNSETFPAVLEARYVLGEVFAREDVSGITINPRYITSSEIGTFNMSKLDLPFGKQKE